MATKRKETTKERAYAKALNLIKRARTEIIWTTARKDEYSIAELGDMHLKNILVFLTRKQKEFTECGVGDYIVNDMTANEWLEIFRDELKYREANGIKVADANPASRFLTGGW